MSGKLLFSALLSSLVAVAIGVPQVRAGGIAVVTSHATANGCNCGMCGINASGIGLSSPARATTADLAANLVATEPVSQPYSLDPDPYGGQKTCPVSGKPLGTMGKAIAVTVKGTTIYLCCNGCVAKLNANPDFYLAKVQKEVGKK